MRNVRARHPEDAPVFITLSVCAFIAGERQRSNRSVLLHDISGGSSTINGKMTAPEIRNNCKLGREAESLLKSAMEELGLSARAQDKILRVGRTIADLDSSDYITAVHLSEAINYRTLDRRYWA